MKNDVPNLVWRDGRPRWEPGPSTRAKGFRGCDLKDENGRWLSLAEAREAAAERNRQFRQHSANSRTRSRKGIGSFVYFLRSGSMVKIGYSTEPLQRVADLNAGIAAGIDLLFCVPGTKADEARIHAAFAATRRKGEWFAIDVALQSFLELMVVSGRLPAEVPPVRKSDIRRFRGSYAKVEPSDVPVRFQRPKI